METITLCLVTGVTRHTLQVSEQSTNRRPNFVCLSVCMSTLRLVNERSNMTSNFSTDLY